MSVKREREHPLAQNISANEHVVTKAVALEFALGVVGGNVAWE
jgi:hypothetical protein